MPARPRQSPPPEIAPRRGQPDKPVKSHPEWTTPELRLIEKHYAKMRLKAFVAEYLPHRTPRAVERQAMLLGVTTPRRWYGEWTPDEDAILHRHYNAMGPQDLHHQLMPQRTLAAIKVRAQQLGIPIPRDPNWTRAEIATLRRHYGKLPNSELAARYLPRRSVDAVQIRAKLQGLTAESDEWTRQECALLRRNYKTSSAAQMAEAILPNRTAAAIRGQMQKLGLRKLPSRSSWSEKDLRTLTAKYETDIRLADLAKALKRTPRAVTQRANAMGLRRSERGE